MEVPLSNLDSLNSDERKILAIIAQTDLLSNEMLEGDRLAKNIKSAVLSLASQGFIEIKKDVNGIFIEIDPRLSAHLHLEFLQLPLETRKRICIAISENLKARSKIIEMLEVLNNSGDKRLFTDSMIHNTIQITSNRDANRLNYLASQMLIENPLEAFAQETFKVAASIWSGNYLQALAQLDSLEILARNGAVSSELIPTIPLLRFIATTYMGRPLTSMEHLKEFLKLSSEKMQLQPTARLLASKVLASTALITLNQSTLNMALSLISDNQVENMSKYSGYLMLQLEAIQLFVAGDLKNAREKAELALGDARAYGYEDSQGPLESLFILACYWEEQLENEKALEYWQELLNHSISGNLPTWQCVAGIRMSRCKNFTNPFVNVIEEITAARNFYNRLPYRHDLDLVVDIEELIYSYRMNNLERCEALLLRIPQNSRCEEIKMAIEAKKSKTLSKIINLKPENPRQEIYKLLYQFQREKPKEEQQSQELVKLLNLAYRYGYKRILALQGEYLSSLIIRMASEGDNSFYEEISRAIAVVSERGSARGVEERLALTNREKEILSLLAAGFGRAEICSHMNISLNTLKTHQKNLYKKLGTNSRLGAITAARRLGLLSV